MILMQMPTANSKIAKMEGTGETGEGEGTGCDVAEKTTGSCSHAHDPVSGREFDA